MVSYLTPYRVNRLTLDTFNLSDDLTLPETEFEVVPTAGAVAFGHFSASIPAAAKHAE